MTFWRSMAVAAALMVPAAVTEAQRPSNSTHTRSAEIYFQEASKSDKTPAEKQELYKKALAASVAGFQAEPGNPKPWFLAGRAYARLGDVAGADSAFTKAEQMYPEYEKEITPERLNAWIGAYNAGVKAVQAGDVPGAIVAFENADRIYRKRADALVTLGSIYMQVNDNAKAEDTFKRALAILRGDRSGLKPEQLKSWQEDELTVAMRLATLYADQSRNDDAEKVFRDLLAAQPNNAMAKVNLGVVLSRAGKTEEAAKVYKELIGVEDLAESTLFNIGIGFFRASMYSDAATAFRRAAKLNPRSHETLYNLAQALFASGSELEKSRAGAPAARQAEIDAERAKISEEMRTVAETLRGIDPGNPDVLMILAQSQRTLAEFATGAAAEDLRKQTLATLELHKAMPFAVNQIQVVPSKSEYQVMGRVTNLALAAGAPLRIKFIVVNAEGAEIGAEEISVAAPAKDESARFDATVKVPEGAVAWKYVIIR